MPILFQKIHKFRISHYKLKMFVRVASSNVVMPLSNSEVGVTLVMFLSMKSVSSSDVLFSMLSMNSKLSKAANNSLISNLHHHTVLQVERDHCILHSCGLRCSLTD